MSTNGWVALGLAVTACVVAALMRLFPLEWNFVPIGALALFAGARLRSWSAFGLPLALMLLTDFLLSVMRPVNPFLHTGTVYVYGSFLLIFILGRRYCAGDNYWRIGAVSFAGSVLFFLITNFGTWFNVAVLRIDPGDYSPTLAGLLHCYEMGIPFYRGTFFGDLIFSAILFGSYAWLTRAVFATKHVAVQTGD